MKIGVFWDTLIAPPSLVQASTDIPEFQINSPDSRFATVGQAGVQTTSADAAFTSCQDTLMDSTAIDTVPKLRTVPDLSIKERG